MAFGKFWNSEPCHQRPTVEMSFMNALRSTYCILMAITICATGCIARRPDPNPLVGWKETRSQDPDKLAKAIRDDYLDYIEHLPPEEKKLLGMINFYEDRSGRHGVRMEIDLH